MKTGHTTCESATKDKKAFSQCIYKLTSLSAILTMHENSFVLFAFSNVYSLLSADLSEQLHFTVTALQLRTTVSLPRKCFPQSNKRGNVRKKVLRDCWTVSTNLKILLGSPGSQTQSAETIFFGQVENNDNAPHTVSVSVYRIRALAMFDKVL